MHSKFWLLAPHKPTRNRPQLASQKRKARLETITRKSHSHNARIRSVRQVLCRRGAAISLAAARLLFAPLLRHARLCGLVGSRPLMAHPRNSINQPTNQLSIACSSASGIPLAGLALRSAHHLLPRHLFLYAAQLPVSVTHARPHARPGVWT